jgi:hypothetical protein
MRYRWDPPYPTSGRRPATNPNAGLRASDAERNLVADRLARHFADGRLDQPEFKARLDRAMGATTLGDLDGLFDDLPPVTDEAPPAPSRRRRVVPFLVLIVLVSIAASWSLPFGHVPWVLLFFVVAIFWFRGGRHHHSHPELDH